MVINTFNQSLYGCASAEKRFIGCEQFRLAKVISLDVIKNESNDKKYPQLFILSGVLNSDMKAVVLVAKKTSVH